MKKIQVLGTGCPKCKKLFRNIEKAALDLHIDFEIEKVEDIAEIMDFGVIMTPALVIDGEVVMYGKAPSAKKLRPYLVD